MESARTEREGKAKKGEERKEKLRSEKTQEKRIRRFRLGIVGLREIRRFQKSTWFLYQVVAIYKVG